MDRSNFTMQTIKNTSRNNDPVKIQNTHKSFYKQKIAKKKNEPSNTKVKTMTNFFVPIARNRIEICKTANPVKQLDKPKNNKSEIKENKITSCEVFKKQYEMINTIYKSKRTNRSLRILPRRNLVSVT